MWMIWRRLGGGIGVGDGALFAFGTVRLMVLL